MRGNNWDVLDLEGVREVALQAARRVNYKYKQHTELEDLNQEALLVLVKDHEAVRVYVEEENLGGLQHRLEQRLYNTFRTDMKHREKHISYEVVSEYQEDGSFVLPYVAIATTTNDYTRESVESLLPAVWDETYTYGMPKKDTAPDPDMPKGSTNKAHGNDLSAYIADIKTGWEKTPLTLKERRALILAYGFGWTHEQIAYNQDVHRSTITHRIEAAVGKIVARLNGGIWYELAGVEA